MTKEELYNYYIVENHSRADTAMFFNVSESKIKRKIKEYELVKEKSKISEVMSNSQKVFLDKDVLFDLYITKNLSLLECARELNQSPSIVKRRLKDFKIKKIGKKFREVHRKHANQTELSTKKRQLTVMKKYGVDNVSKAKQIKKQKEITTRQHYGVDNPFQSTNIKEQISKDNMQKYGVPYSCMREECRKYSGNNSKPNQKFEELLEKHKINYEREFPLENYSYDFKVDNYLFEINPTVFHNSTISPVGNPKDKMYHFCKSEKAQEYNYRCIHVFDWDDPEKIIKLFLIPKERIYARQCELKGVTVKEAHLFLEENHLQGYAKDKIRLGLYYKNKLVEIMTFDKPRYNKNYDWELVRLCSNANVVGGAEKILKYFVDTYKPQSIISYCDLAKFDGRIYKQLGFSAANKPQPSKHWVNLSTKQHITDNLLRQKGFDQLFKTRYGKGTDNEELMRENGFVEVYDCGQLVFSFINK